MVGAKPITTLNLSIRRIIKFWYWNHAVETLKLAYLSVKFYDFLKDLTLLAPPISN